MTRRLTTVVDTLGLDRERRAAWIALAHDAGVSTVCVVFATPARECRARNRARHKVVPDRVLTGLVRRVREQQAGLADEGFDVVIEPTTIRTAPTHVARDAPLAERQRDDPVGLRFGLQIATYNWPGGAIEMRTRLAAIARSAEAAGFSSLWVMDHFRQIPRFGRPWDNMLESYTALAYVAAVTERMRLGTLVTGITHRNVAHLGKIVATLDVVSRGRAVCGLGLGWFEAEHRALGWRFPPRAERYALLEDALQFLPIFWGKGTPAFAGRVLNVPEAMCYPRPVQERIPILVGGNGEQRTLRLAAMYADACNIIGELDVVARKVDVLRAHCAAVARDAAAVEVTQLSTTLVGRDAADLGGLIERLRPRRTSADTYAASVNAGTVTDQVGRFRALAQAGVHTAIVSLPDLAETEPIERFGKVIASFR